MTTNGDGERLARLVGARVARLRKTAGFDTVEALVDRIDNPRVTVSVIQNLESKRKKEIDVELLLELAFALEVPPILLLTEMNRPNEPVAIPGVSEAISNLSQHQFDSWFSGVGSFLYDLDVRVGSDRVEALAALRSLLRELVVWEDEEDELRRARVRNQADQGQSPETDEDARHRLRRNRIDGLFLKARRKLDLDPRLLPWNRHG